MVFSKAKMLPCLTQELPLFAHLELCTTSFKYPESTHTLKKHSSPSVLSPTRRNLRSRQFRPSVIASGGVCSSMTASDKWHFTKTLTQNAVAVFEQRRGIWGGRLAFQQAHPHVCDECKLQGLVLRKNAAQLSPTRWSIAIMVEKTHILSRLDWKEGGAPPLTGTCDHFFYFF